MNQFVSKKKDLKTKNALNTINKHFFKGNYIVDFV